MKRHGDFVYNSLKVQIPPRRGDKVMVEARRIRGHTSFEALPISAHVEVAPFASLRCPGSMDPIALA